jgi:hypothetical protein
MINSEEQSIRGTATEKMDHQREFVPLNLASYLDFIASLI